MILSLANLRTLIALTLAASLPLVAVALDDDEVEQVVERVVEYPATLDEDVRRLIDENVEKPNCERGQLGYPCIEKTGHFGLGRSHCFDYPAKEAAIMRSRQD